MAWKLDAQSLKALEGVHPDMERVVLRAAALSPIPFRVTEGRRTLARQRELVRTGMSKTLNSRHLTGHAVDIVPMVDVTGDGRVTGEDMWHHAQLVKLSPYIKQAFKAEGVPYDWGGDWRNAWDKPHWQLTWKRYPVQVASLGGDMELYEAWTDIQEDGRMETPYITPSAASMAGAGGAGAGGLGLVGQAVTDLQQAQGHFNAGNVFGIVIGSLVLIGAGLAIYHQWDAAGRPLPSFLKRRG